VDIERRQDEKKENKKQKKNKEGKSKLRKIIHYYPREKQVRSRKVPEAHGVVPYCEELRRSD